MNTQSNCRFPSFLKKNGCENVRINSIYNLQAFASYKISNADISPLKKNLKIYQSVYYSIRLLHHYTLRLLHHYTIRLLHYHTIRLLHHHTIRLLQHSSITPSNYSSITALHHASFTPFINILYHIFFEKLTQENKSNTSLNKPTGPTNKFFTLNKKIRHLHISLKIITAKRRI